MTFRESVTLQPSGDELPLLGITVEDLFPNDAERITYDSIKKGYRTIPTTMDIDNNAAIGKGINRAITDGIVKREELFIIGRLYSSYRRKEHIKPVLQMILDSLALNYLDLCLVYFPFAVEYIDPKQFSSEPEETDKLKLEKVPMEETWGELEALVDAGLIRNLGVSHFGFQSLMNLLELTRIPPSVLEIEHHPYFQQKGLVKWARSKGMHILAHAPLGEVSFYYNLQNLVMNKTVEEVANKHDINERQVLLAWAARHQAVFIADGSNGYYADRYVAVDPTKLDDDDMKKMDDLEADARFYKFSVNVEGIVLPVF